MLLEKICRRAVEGDLQEEGSFPQGCYFCLKWEQMTQQGYDRGTIFMRMMKPRAFLYLPSLKIDSTCFLCWRLGCSMSKGVLVHTRLTIISTGVCEGHLHERLSKVPRGLLVIRKHHVNIALPLFCTHPSHTHHSSRLLLSKCSFPSHTLPFLMLCYSQAFCPSLPASGLSGPCIILS